MALSILAAPLAAEPQQAKKVPRVGWLMVNFSPRSEAFREGLRELGYVEGQNITIEVRNVEGKLDRLPGFAAELVRLKVDLIVALEPPALDAVKNATKTVPIVMRSTDDPVETGLIASLARPGGNITGLTSVSTELTGKRLEILKEVVPKLHRVAVLLNPASRHSAFRFKETEVAARSLGLELLSVEVRTPDEFDGAFRAATKGRASALIPLRNPIFVLQQRRLVDMAVKSRLPVIYDDRAFVEVGGLMSYGTTLADLNRRAATYVDKILKGAKPADLPVEQPAKFELVINRRTAKALGLTIPPSVLLRAALVIE